MRDINETSYETPLGDLPEDTLVMICWLGDDKEPNLTKIFEGHLDKGIGWYWILPYLFPVGPFDTSTEAHNDFTQYISEK